MSTINISKDEYIEFLKWKLNESSQHHNDFQKPEGLRRDDFQQYLPTDICNSCNKDSFACQCIPRMKPMSTCSKCGEKYGITGEHGLIGYKSCSCEIVNPSGSVFDLVKTKERQWEEKKKTMVGLCQICDKCGGSSVSTCQCARERFLEIVSTAPAQPVGFLNK
jgi:hypothetical protein